MKRFLCILLIAALLLPCGACAAGTDAAGTASVTFFKAGKADAALIRTESAAVLIDTGLAKNADELIEALRKLGVTALDALILSHFDKDHVGGAADILGSFPVGTVYQSNYPKDSDEYEAYVEALSDAGVTPVTVSDAVSFTLDGLTFSIDGPDEAEYDKDPSNNSSLIVTVTGGDAALLFAGDAQDARITEYLARFERPEGKLILKVPYHGHWQDTLTAFLEAAAPDIAVIPCSKSEPDEEELQKTLALLESLGAETHLTYEGDYTIQI